MFSYWFIWKNVLTESLVKFQTPYLIKSNKTLNKTKNAFIYRYFN